MRQITLNRKKAQELLDFCNKSDKKEFFVAKDFGAYVGASNGPEDSCLFHFRHCDPDKNERAFWTARELFGNDDFTFHLPIDWLEKVCAEQGARSLTIKVSEKAIKAVINKE